MNLTFKRLAVLSAGAALFTLPLTTLNPALAACAPDNPAAGGTVTCSAIDSDGFLDLDENITVNVLSDAQVINPGGRGIEVRGDGSAVNNAGAIDVDATGITVFSNSHVTNSGSVESADIGIRLDDNNEITNSGTIIADHSGDGIRARHNNVILNTGVVNSDQDIGIIFVNDNVVINSGTIIANSDGIRGSDRNRVINNGAISSSDSDGIEVGDDAYITNNGTIEAYEEGIDAGGNAHIINSGTIEVDDEGIDAGGNAHITNSGTITSEYDGIEADVGSKITNSGTITSRSEDGINADDDAQITNSGTITADEDGIHVENGSQITNSGTIISDDDGIQVNNDSQITNNGTIIASDNGILSGTNIEITNSGSIINSNGPSGSAINLDSGVNVVNLLAGSVLVGTVNPGGGVDTLNLGAGLDAIVMVTGTPFEFVNFGSRLGVVSGSTVYQADTTAQEQTDDVLAGIASGVGQTVLDRISSAFGDDVQPDSTSGYAALTKQSTSETAIETAVSGYGDKNERNYWASLWGSASNGEAAGGVDANLRHGGFVSGVDWMTDGNLMGFFSGGSLSKITADINNGQSTEIKSYYGGGYGRWTKGNMYIDAVVSGGVMSFSSERLVANNLILGGLEKAEADYLGYYIAPTVTFSSIDGLQGTELMPSLTLGYAGLFLDGFTETGSMANLTVEDRDIHVATARFQLAIDKEFIANDGSMTKFRPYFGVEAKAGFGDADHLKVTLANQALSVSLGGDEVVYRGFGGVTFDKRLSDTASLNGGLEFGLGSNNSVDASAKLGFSMKF